MNRFITSRLGVEYRDSLERIFFFHPEQYYFEQALLRHIETFGSPQVACSGNWLSITLPALPEAQTLYAVEHDQEQLKLLGVMVIHRTSETILEMHHIAINPELTHWGKKGDSSVAALLIGELCRIGSRIRGIEKVRLAYHRGEIAVGLPRAPLG